MEKPGYWKWLFQKIKNLPSNIKAEFKGVWNELCKETFWEFLIGLLLLTFGNTLPLMFGVFHKNILLTIIHFAINSIVALLLMTHSHYRDDP